QRAAWGALKSNRAPRGPSRSPETSALPHLIVRSRRAVSSALKSNRVHRAITAQRAINEPTPARSVNRRTGRRRDLLPRLQHDLDALILLVAKHPERLRRL